MSRQEYHEMFPLGEDEAPYRKLTDKFVATVRVNGREILEVAPEGLTLARRSGDARLPASVAPRPLWRN